MKYTVSLLAMAVLAGLFFDPQQASGQNKDILQLQRDLYDVNKAVTELKQSNTDQSAQIQAQLKQILDANTKLSAEVRDLQSKMAAQQKQIVDPLTAAKKSVDDLWNSTSSIESKVNAMRTDQGKMNDRLTSLSGQLGLMQQEMTKAPATNPADSAALAFAAAQRDRLAGNLPFALSAFHEVSQKYPSEPWAPMAVLEIGNIYSQNGQYQDALAAYDRVLEQFGENPMRKPAQFHKAEQLANLGRNSDAAREYDSFAKQYPGDENAPVALQQARELRVAGASKAKQPPPKSKGKR